jgi:predicted metal-dependent hydrolase
VQLRFPFDSAADPAEPAHAVEQKPAAEHAKYADKPPLIHFVRMRRARRYVMRVRPDGDLRVTIPRGGSKAEALRFAERHMDWAARQRARVMEGRRPAAVDRELRARAAAELPPQLLALAVTHGLTVNRVTIRNQRSRWGSCSSRGHITLNFRLMLMPPEVREYILIHELMHLKQANHSIRFWRCVEAACPGFREAERWLKKHGPSLF